MLRALALSLALLPCVAGAQEVPRSAGSAILTILPDRLFAETKAGKTSEARIAAAGDALAAENRRIEAEMEAEERDLTARRSVMPDADFRVLADAFDAKAERTREEQGAKLRAITRMREQHRQAFIQAIGPILGKFMRDEGAVAILDRGSVLVSFDEIDVTDKAIAAIDAQLGTAEDLFGPAPDPAP